MSSTTVSTLKGFPPTPELLADETEHRRQLARAVNQLRQGRLNCKLDITLNANTGATVISDYRLGYNSAVFAAMPMTLDAAADIGTIWCDPPIPASGSTTATITVHHRSNAATDRTIRFIILD